MRRRLLVFLTIKPNKTLTAKQPHCYNANLIEDNQRYGHEELVYYIRGRGENSSNNKGKQDSILAMFSEEGCIYNANLCQKHHKNRQFKNNAKGNQQSQA